MPRMWSQWEQSLLVALSVFSLVLVIMPTNRQVEVPSSNARVKVTLAMCDFNCQDVSAYESLVISEAENGTAELESAFMPPSENSGYSLNCSSSAAGESFVRWGWGLHHQWGWNPLWAAHGLHLRLDICICSSPVPNVCPVFKWQFDASGISLSNIQMWFTGDLFVMQNSTSDIVSTAGFSYDAWHWMDIYFNFEVGKIEVFWDSYDAARVEIEERDSQFSTIQALDALGDDWNTGSAGNWMIDNLELIGEAPIIGSGKLTYFTEIICLKGTYQNDIAKYIAVANTTNLHYTFLISNSTSYLGNKTVTDEIKKYIAGHPDSIAGMWIGGMPSATTVENYCQSFYDVFGYYPQAIGAYSISNTVYKTAKKAPYNVRAFMSCVADANGYTQFWNYPFFISDGCAQVPSLIPVGERAVGFQWASTHPLWYCDDSKVTFLTQSDYFYGGVASAAPMTQQFWIYEANNSYANPFGYITSGIETDCDWVNSTRAMLSYNWTCKAYDKVIKEHPDIYVSKNLLEMADYMLMNFTETPQYLLFYPRWDNCTAPEYDIWIVENQAYRSFVFKNTTYFGIIGLEIFGNTTKYPFDNGDMFAFHNCYPEIIRSSEFPWHGISIDGFVPASLNVTKHEENVPYIEFVAANSELIWKIQYYTTPSHSLNMTVKALDSFRTATFRLEITVRRNESKSGWGWSSPIMYDWGTLFTIDDSLYIYDNITSHGMNIGFGFDLSSVWIHSYPSIVANITKNSNAKDERSVVVSYSYLLDKDAEVALALGFGFDTPSVPELNVMSTISLLIVAAVMIVAARKETIRRIRGVFSEDVS